MLMRETRATLQRESLSQRHRAESGEGWVACYRPSARWRRSEQMYISLAPGNQAAARLATRSGAAGIVCRSFCAHHNCCFAIAQN
jgi:hypothetical protein